MKVNFANVYKFTGVVLLLLIFVGCSSDSDAAGDSADPEATNLVFWAPFSGGDADFMRDLIANFNEAHEGIEVEYLTVPDSEYYTKIRTSVTSNQAPDIAISHASRIAELQSSNLIENLDEFASEAAVDWDSYNQNILSSTIINDQHFAIPLDTHALIMYANKDILEEAGVLDSNGLPIVGEGADGFIDFLSTIKENTSDDIFPLAATSSGYSALRVWWTLYSQMGGELLNEAGTEAAFNNEIGLEALHYMEELMDQGLWPRNIQNGGEIFTANRAGIHINGVWMTGALENNESLNFVALPIPQLFGEQATWGDSHTFVLPANQNQTEEKKVASLLFADWVAENSASWAEAGHVPSKTSVVESNEFNELPYRKDYAELTDYVSFMPSSSKTTGISDSIARHISTFMSGQTNAQETLDILEQDINNILSN
ncbi:ABC transporter substrate-binding protein [Halalkalibacter alkaliphilus]|uniref:ABC transporter substrate-binding protein n=1 Tax=Halalkalibacter alkaliphilus TaxID=2917993 RepID=A0A9X2CRR8_9BACI|nr:ABC transporter substrate-binding protein [Halalkalibacter alkaliphilus]MCL7746820.1 ABC transporter substrate-binding protein [Halalkalibacter alkaliphilus]